MSAQILAKNLQDADYSYNARRWTPAFLISIATNLLFFQIFVWIIYSGAPNVEANNPNTVRLVVSQMQPVPKPVKAVEKPKIVDKPKPEMKNKVVKTKKVEVKPKPAPVVKPQTEVVKFEPEESVEENTQPFEEEVLENSVEPEIESVVKPFDVSMLEEMNPKKSEPIIPTPLFLVTKNPITVFAKKPEYPEEKREFGEEGVVFASWIVDADGSVKQIEIIESLGKSFDVAVINAIKNSKFSPGYVNGKAVAVKVSKKFIFVLE